MKARRLLKQAVIAMLVVLCNGNLYGQAFPTIWDLSNYDVERGTKGRLFEINSDAVSPSTSNKAYIFTTNTSNGLKDLFRVTTAGVVTLHSPFPTYPIKLDFFSQDLWQGYILGTGSRLDVIGKTEVRVGTNEHFDIVSVTPGNVAVGGTIKLDYSNIRMRYGLSDDQQDGWAGTESQHPLVLGTNSRCVIYLDENQKTYIGMTPPEAKAIRSEVRNAYSVFVKKGLLAEDLAIGPQSSWSDFVFDKNYRLRPLSEVKDFIQANKHLPDVPSAEEVAKEGYSQHEINKALLQKVEELTLYILEQQKEIEMLKAKLNQK